MHNPQQQHSLVAQTHASAPLALASSLQDMASSPTLAINEAVAARRAAGRKTIHLGFGEASFPLHPLLNEALARAAKHTGYAPVAVISPLRKAIAAYLERTRHPAFTPDQIIVAPGSKPLLYTLLQALEGDLLLPAPSWVSYAPHARLAGRRVITVETDPEDHHRLTPQTLANTLSYARQQGANPRILIVNTPSNPTGGMFTREDTEAIALWSSDATPIQEAAVTAYRPNAELTAYVQASARIHGHVAFRLYEALTSMGVLCPRPAGAFYLYPDFAPWRSTLLERGIATSEQLAQHLLDTWDIATLPGTAFGEQPEALRLRLATSMLYIPEDAQTEDEKEKALWDLLAQAQKLSQDDVVNGILLEIPALERAQERLREFVQSLGS